MPYTVKLKSILIHISEQATNEHMCLQIKSCFQQPPAWDFAQMVLCSPGIASCQYCHSSSETSTTTGSSSTQAPLSYTDFNDSCAAPLS